MSKKKCVEGWSRFLSINKKKKSKIIKEVLFPKMWKSIHSLAIYGISKDLSIFKESADPVGVTFST
jgi:hypothetical protein